MSSAERLSARKGNALAIIADELVQQQRLRATLVDAGYDVAICTSPKNLAHYRQDAPPVDLWIIDADFDACPEHQLDWLLDNAAHRLLFNEGPDCPRDDPEYSTWTRRILATVERLLANPASVGIPSNPSIGSERKPGAVTLAERNPVPAEPLLVDTTPQAPEAARLPLPPELADWAETHPPGAYPPLWILAASLGGPVAVKQFLDALPACLPCTFIYAQHIDAEFETQLARSIGRHSLLPLACMLHNDRLKAGHVYIAPIRHSIHFTHGGQVKMHNQPWHGPYSPSLDELLGTAASQYPGPVHSIVFSGMAGDAVKGSAAVRERGGEVWIQQADSCIQSAMPRLLKDAELTTRESDPRGLARHLLQHLTAQVRAAVAPTQAAARH